MTIGRPSPHRSASQEGRQRIQKGRHAMFVDVLTEIRIRIRKARQNIKFGSFAVADLQTRPTDSIMINQSQKAVRTFTEGRQRVFLICPTNRTHYTRNLSGRPSAHPESIKMIILDKHQHKIVTVFSGEN